MDVKPAVAACHNFYRNVSGSPEKVTMILAPIKLVEKGNETKITWACNNGRWCHNPYCEYAHPTIEAVAQHPLQ